MHDTLHSAATPPIDGVLASTVTREKVQWLWPGRIPLGKLTVLDGDPGLGKSILTIDVAARITSDCAFPDGSKPGASGGVVMLTAEDGQADTICPRLQEAGADLQRVRLISEINDGEGAAPRPPAFPNDIARVERAIHEMRAVLFVLDPLFSFFASGLRYERDPDVRKVLTPFAQVAERTGCAMLVVRHLTKTSHNDSGALVNPLYRGGGSIGVIGVARMGLLMAQDPDDDERRVLAVTKSNLSKMAPSLGFRIAVNDQDVPRIEWLGEVAHRCKNLLDPSKARRTPQKQSEAEWFLRGLLMHGPFESVHVEAAAENVGISESTLNRARQSLGVLSYQDSEGGTRWMCKLPEPAAGVLGEVGLLAPCHV